MEFDRWAVPNVVDLIAQAKSAVLENHSELTEKDLNIRFMWSEDWDQYNATQIQANTYIQDFNTLQTNTFRINKVDKAYAVVLIGCYLGNLGNLLNSVQIIIGQKTVREYPGTLISSQLNGIILFPDGIFTLEKKKVEFTFFVQAGAPLQCTTFPWGVVIIPAGA